MKGTTSEDIWAAIYADVILPLKGESFADLLPRTDYLRLGPHRYSFSVRTEDVQGQFSHRYQRQDARDRAYHIVYLDSSTGFSSILADFDPIKKHVRFYDGAVGTDKKVRYLFGKLQETLHDSSLVQSTEVLTGKRRESSVLISPEGHRVE